MAKDISKAKSGNVKSEAKANIQKAKASIDESKRQIDKAKLDIKAAKLNIKKQKNAIKEEKARLKNAKAEAKEEKATAKEEKKTEKANDVQKSPVTQKAEKAAKPAVTPTVKLGKFVIKITSNDMKMFNLLSANGQVIATSQMYTTYDACQNGIKSVGTNAPIAPIEDQTVEGYTPLPNPKFELYIDKGGSDYRFRLKAKNGQNIVASQGYSTKEACLEGIESVKINSKTRIIDEE